MEIKSKMEKEPNLLLFQSPDEQTDLFVLGTVHGAHFEESTDYSIADVQSVIETVKPDLLLVEVRQETVDKDDILDGPVEMLFAWSYAQSTGIPVRGIDWWQITEESRSNWTNAERDDQIYDNIMKESTGYNNILVLCGADHRIEQSKRLKDNGYKEVEMQDKASYFGNVSPESFTYPPLLRTILEEKREWSKTGIYDEINAGTSEQSEARRMWVQNAENMTASIDQMLEQLVEPNALYYSQVELG
jgi:hypothetical protein